MTKEGKWGKKIRYERDWVIYNNELVKRGEFYFDLNFLEYWDKEVKDMNKGKIGHPYQYPNSLFEYLMPLSIFLDYRKLEGVLNKLSKYIKKLKSCDYTTIFYRLNKIRFNLNLDKTREYDIIFDSTGNKLTNRGEYIRHKWKIRRGWIKVSIVIDKKTNDLLDVEVSLEDVSDYKLVEKHLDNLQDIKINTATGDGAYYVSDLFHKFKKRKITPIIKPRKNASKNGFDPIHSYAKKVYLLGGYNSWKDKYDYTKRWLVESKFSAIKRSFGENLRATKYVFNEAKRKIFSYEKMKNYPKLH